MKSKTKDEKQLPIVYDKVNSNNLRRFEPRQMEKFVAKQPDTSVSITTSFEAFELSNTDINHNDIIPSCTSVNSEWLNPSKPPVQTSSSSCSWWLLFLVNPSKQILKPQQKSDNDILSNESVSHITLCCDHIKNVGSNMKHPYILQTPHFTQPISAANYQLSLSSSNTSTKMCCNEKLNLTTLESEHPTDTTRVKTNCDTHFATSELERKKEDDKSKLVFATKSSSKCVGPVPRNKHQFMKFTKKKALNKIVHLLCACFWVVMFFYVIKTVTRNQDWSTRKTLFR